MNRKFILSALCLLLPLIAVSKSINEGIYTKQQAERGKAIFVEECAKCHGENLAGGEGPELASKEFVSRWKGNSVGSLFDIIRKTMPTDDPGHLSTRQAADITALVLSANGYPAGDQELDNKVETLNQIKIEARP